MEAETTPYPCDIVWTSVYGVFHFSESLKVCSEDGASDNAIKKKKINSFSSMGELSSICQGLNRFLQQ